MLCLSRSNRQRIVIGKKGDVLEGPIILTINEILQFKVRLGFDGQRDVRIMREEIADEPIDDSRNSRPARNGSED